ncbi:MAG: hypothetical protein M3347_08410 [Armatimonadota bacterium]|nr:hypothetical protein [Armatimonadota bacterium]
MRDELLFAAGWLQRAEMRLRTPGYDDRYLTFARDLTQKVERKKAEGGLEIPLWEEFGWWKDYFPGNYQPTDQDPMPQHGAGFLARSGQHPRRMVIQDFPRRMKSTKLVQDSGR